MTGFQQQVTDVSRKIKGKYDATFSGKRAGRSLNPKASVLNLCKEFQTFTDSWRVLKRKAGKSIGADMTKIDLDKFDELNVFGLMHYEKDEYLNWQGQPPSGKFKKSFTQNVRLEYGSATSTHKPSSTAGIPLERVDLRKPTSRPGQLTGGNPPIQAGSSGLQTDSGSGGGGGQSSLESVLTNYGLMGIGAGAAVASIQHMSPAAVVALEEGVKSSAGSGAILTALGSAVMGQIGSMSQQGLLTLASKPEEVTGLASTIAAKFAGITAALGTPVTVALIATLIGGAVYTMSRGTDTTPPFGETTSAPLDTSTMDWWTDKDKPINVHSNLLDLGGDTDPTPAPTEPPTAAPTEPPTAAPTVAPTEMPTEAPPGYVVFNVLGPFGGSTKTMTWSQLLIEADKGYMVNIEDLANAIRDNSPNNPTVVDGSSESELAGFIQTVNMRLDDPITDEPLPYEMLFALASSAESGPRDESHDIVKHAFKKRFPNDTAASMFVPARLDRLVEIQTAQVGYPGSSPPEGEDAPLHGGNRHLLGSSDDLAPWARKGYPNLEENAPPGTTSWKLTGYKGEKKWYYVDFGDGTVYGPWYGVPPPLTGNYPEVKISPTQWQKPPSGEYTLAMPQANNLLRWPGDSLEKARQKLMEDPTDVPPTAPSDPAKAGTEFGVGKDQTGVVPGLPEQASQAHLAAGQGKEPMIDFGDDTIGDYQEAAAAAAAAGLPPPVRPSIPGEGGGSGSTGGVADATPLHAGKRELAAGLVGPTQPMIPDIVNTGTDESTDTTVHRVDTVHVGGDMVKQTYEQKVLQEMLVNNFDYVSANGYLGNDSSIYIDGVWRQDHQVRSHAPLAMPRMPTLNHGLHPMKAELCDSVPQSAIAKVFKRKRDRHDLLSKAKKTRTVASTPLPGDQNDMASTANLPYLKPSQRKFAIDTRMRTHPTKDPAGYKMNGLMKSSYDTWNKPYLASSRLDKRKPVIAASVSNYLGSDHYTY